MAKTAQVKIAEASAPAATFTTGFSSAPTSVRVSPNSYFIAVFLTVFFTAYFIYIQQDLIGLILFALSAVVIPSLAWTDRIVFDGEKIWRTGIVPRLWKWINRESQSLKSADIEQVETQAARALKRGGKVFYRYRTSIHGDGKIFVFTSGGEDYRQMIRKLFGVISIDALDNRSIELRDYLMEPKETLMKAAFAKLPSSDVLENSINEFQNPERHLRSRRRSAAAQGEIEKANYLRELANELRLSGNLLQALEAFRRALRLNPLDAWLIFEFGRCLHSYASSEQNEKLQKKARAALRLAEMRAGRNSELLSRLGESYFQYGDRERARTAFHKSLGSAAESFRSVRGLAEIALREGKIAHVIHHFTNAGHFAETNAMRRWAQGETEYFSRLNNDENYMDAEIRRMNWLENIERSKKTSLKIVIAGFATILLGLVLDDTVANIGWACGCVSLLIWAGLIMSRNLLSERSAMSEGKNN